MAQRMYQSPPLRMYTPVKPWSWHTVETHSARYTSSPVFEPPQPPQIFLPHNPFISPEEPPSDEPEGNQPEADAPPPEGDPPAETGRYTFMIYNISN